MIRNSGRSAARGFMQFQAGVFVGGMLIASASIASPQGRKEIV